MAAGKQKVPTPEKAINLHKQMAGYAKGGKVHGDEVEDKKMIKKMVKPSALKCKGGKVKK